MKRDDNYGKETQYKIVREFIERRNRANYYLWECKICNQMFGPTAIWNILQEGRVGICCKQAYARKERYEKYEKMVGDLVTPNKRLIEFLGETPGRFPSPLFKYECVHCGREYGPNQLKMIGFYQEVQCCQPGIYNQIGYGVVSTRRIKTQYSLAKTRGWDCDLTAKFLDSLWHEQDARCVYTGVKFESVDIASIDRIDSSRGYLCDNVQWVLREVNVMKLDMTHDRFLELCSMITNRQKEKENDDSK